MLQRKLLPACLLLASVAAGGEYVYHQDGTRVEGEANESFYCPRPSSWTRPFFATVLADPQVGWNVGPYNSEDLFRKAAAHVKRLDPDVVLVAGDLVHSPGHEGQYRVAKSILDGIGIPYHVISGNHDVRNTPTLQKLDQFVAWWDLPYYWYTVPHYNALFVMLESNILRAARDDTDRDYNSDVLQLAREETAWLQATLEEASQGYQHVIPIAHHPVIRWSDWDSDSSSNDEEEDRNQLEANNAPTNMRKELVALFQQHKRTISHVLGGHFHTNAKVDEGGIHYITYGSTGVIMGPAPRDASGFAILKVDGDHVGQNYYGYDFLPQGSRIESDAPGFAISFPSGQLNLEMDSHVCVTWTSQSMAKEVLLEYSLDNGTTWTVMAGNAPNEGVYPWKVPPTPSDQVLIKVSSVHDPTIFATSPYRNWIVSVEEAAAAQQQQQQASSVAASISETAASAASKWMGPGSSDWSWTSTAMVSTLATCSAIFFL